MNQEIKKNPFNAVDTFNSVKNENPSDYTEAKNRLEELESEKQSLENIVNSYKAVK